MPHPMKSQAHSSSRDKFKAITGHSGGGHAHAGGSHLKKAGAHGALKTWSGHRKSHILDDFKAHGGKCKARADRRARGGAKFKSETYGPPDIDRSIKSNLKMDPKSPIAKKEQDQGSENIGTDWYKRLSGRGDKGNRSGFSEADLKGIVHGKRGGKFKRGGRARGGAGDDEDTPGGPLGGANARKEIAAGNKPYTPRREVPLKGWDEPGWSTHPATGRKKYASGGRAKGKAPGKVIINVNAAGPRPAPARPPMPPPMPPAAPPPPPPPAGGGGAPPPGMGGGPGAANPMAALNKGMGGMGFARGGKTKGQHPNPGAGPRGGDAKYDLAGWRKYAQTDREKRLSGRSGMTQAYTKKIGDDGSLDVQPVKPGRRAHGGRMTAGVLSGVGRLEQAHREKRKY